MANSFGDLMIFTYRRNSLEPSGAARISAIETIGLEGMEGGRFQVLAHTGSGLDVFISELLPNVLFARLILEEMRLYLSGTGPFPSMPSERRIVE